MRLAVSMVTVVIQKVEEKREEVVLQSVAPSTAVPSLP